MCFVLQWAKIKSKSFKSALNLDSNEFISRWRESESKRSKVLRLATLWWVRVDGIEIYQIKIRTHSFAGSRRWWNHHSHWTHLPVRRWCYLIANPNVLGDVEALMHHSVYDEYYYHPNEDIEDFLKFRA